MIQIFSKQHMMLYSLSLGIKDFDSPVQLLNGYIQIKSEDDVSITSKGFSALKFFERVNFSDLSVTEAFDIFRSIAIANTTSWYKNALESYINFLSLKEKLELLSLQHMETLIDYYEWSYKEWSYKKCSEPLGENSFPEFSYFSTEALIKLLFSYIPCMRAGSLAVLKRRINDTVSIL